MEEFINEFIFITDLNSITKEKETAWLELAVAMWEIRNDGVSFGQEKSLMNGLWSLVWNICHSCLSSMEKVWQKAETDINGC